MSTVSDFRFAPALPESDERGTVAEAFKAQDALKCVVAAYDKALQDEESKLPSYLMCALEMARRSC